MTNGIGFYKLKTKEVVSRDRKIILKQNETGNRKSSSDESAPKFVYDFADPSGNRQYTYNLFSIKIFEFQVFYSIILK